MDQDSLKRIHDRLERIEMRLGELARRVKTLEDRPETETATAVPIAPAPGVEAKPAAAAPPPPRAFVPPPLPVSAARQVDLAAAAARFSESLNQNAPATPKPGVAPRPAPPPEPPSEPRPDWRDVLRRLNLLPPTEAGGNLEIQVGTWWATRIGMLFLVIAVVFFGVYLAQFSRPWMRLAELTLISFGVTGLGLWLERRYSQYGEVVFGGGLALIFFCAFGAYAVPGVKVLDNPVAGAVLQYVAAGIIIGCALWRASSVIATMAVLSGYVACFFSFSAGLNNFALLAALTLAAVAVYFYQWRAWTLPFILAVPLTYLLYAIILTVGWMAHSNPPPFWQCHAWLIADLGLFAAADLMGLFRGRLLESTQRRAMHLLSSSAAALLGFLVTRWLFQGQLSPYYFTYGGILTALALAYYLLQHPEALMHGYFLKGSALITLGLINALGGRTRWVALGVESFILLFSARRSRLRIVEAMMGVTWMASLLFFALHAIHQPVVTDHVGRSWAYQLVASPLFSVGGLVALFYLLLSALLLGLQGRWLARPGAPDASTPKDDSSFNEFGPRDALNFIYALALGCVGLLVFGANYFPAGSAALLYCLLIAAVGAVGVFSRHWIPFAALVLPLLSAHWVFWRMSPDRPGLIWLNGVAVTVFTLAAAVLPSRRQSTLRECGADQSWLVGIGLLHLIWMISLQILYGKVFSLGTCLFLSVLSSAVIAAVTLRTTLVLLTELAPVVMTLAIVRDLVQTYFPAGEYFAENYGPGIFLWGAVLLAWAYACAFAAWGTLGRGLQAVGNPRQYAAFLGGVAFLIGFFVLGRSPGLHAGVEASPQAVRLVLGWVAVDTVSLPAFGLAGLAVMALARWPGYRPGFYFGLAYLLVAHRVFYAQVVARGAAGAMGFLAMALVLGALTLAAAPLVRRLIPGLPRPALLWIQWLCGVLALVLCFSLFAVQRGTLGHYATALWATAAVAIFLTGLLDRAKPLRLVGLAGLALCIPRVFLMDLSSTFYRIIATGVLGIVVLAVGFLYNKYRPLIEGRDGKA